jgi:hypothetical protein
MSRCFTPYLFDSDRFEADAKRQKPDEDEIAMLVSEHMLSEEAFAGEEDLCPARATPKGATVGGIADNLILGIQRARHPGRKDALLLLEYISEDDGRLAGNDPFLGYLLRREVARLKKVLSAMNLADAWIEADREQFLRVLDIARKRKMGLVYLVT